MAKRRKMMMDEEAAQAPVDPYDERLYGKEHAMPDGSMMQDSEMDQEVEQGGLVESDIPADEVDYDMTDDEEQARRDDNIAIIAGNILKSRSEAVEFRAASGIETYWRIAEQMLDYASDFEATPSMLDYASGVAPIKDSGAKRSRAVMNIVRGRCEVASGRFGEILLPVRDKNWGYKNTPNAIIEDMVGDGRQAMSGGKPVMFSNNTPATMNDVAKAMREQAEKAMFGMERVVNDQLTECSFQAEERKQIDKSVYMGTGILKGPVVGKRLKKTWKPTPDKSGKIAHVLEFSEENKPASYSIDPWNVYPSPDCREDPQKASYIWEKDTIRPREVRRLIGVKGYSARQLEMVLKEQPKRLNVAVDQHGTAYRAITNSMEMGEQYEVWEYNGEIKPEHMEEIWSYILGKECSCDHSKSVSGKIIFINDRPVKASLNLLDTGDLPYDFFPWTPIPDMPWGAGEPIKIMWAQRIINAVWRQMMDNSGDSSGLNVAIFGLEPDDGIWEITGKKLWRWDGESPIDDIRKAITQFQATNNQEHLQKILELALRFIDLMTATPTIFQGEAKEAPDTLGATNIVVDSSNVTYRSKVVRFDDQVTVPHLRRYYDYNMQYHPDPSIKGELEVDPRGASVLFEKDQTRMALLQAFQLKQDPHFAKHTKWKKAIELFYSSSHLDIFQEEPEEGEEGATPEQGAAASQQQAAQATLQAAQIRADTDMQVAMIKQGESEANNKFKGEQADLERAHDLEMKKMDLQISMMQYAEKRNIELDKLKVQLAISSEGLRHSERVMDKKAVAEVSNPPTEPAGKAPTGESYQK